MEKIIIEIIYFSLTNVVPSTIAILIPLAGAFWIFKVREKTAAEGKIFELGREIANILQSKEIRWPIDGISYVYIDEALHKTNEKNRDKALKEMLRKYLHVMMFSKESSREEEREAANIVMAVATERVQSLVPTTVNWSGKGFIFNTYGEDIETKDNYFPFGTKLYKQWIEKFSDIYNDLWAIINSCRFLIDSFSKVYEDGITDIDKELLDNWLNDVENRIKNIHPIHAKLLTQIQIIDTQIDLPRLGKDIVLISLYGLLLSCAGFFMPKLIYSIDLVSIGNILGLTMATILSYLLIAIRIISAVQPVKEKNSQRRIFMPKLAQELKKMERQCMRYTPHVINDILSLESDLKLSSQLKSTLTSLADRIEIFNEYAGILYKKVEELICPIKKEFLTNKENQQGFSIQILELASEEFDLESIKSRIMSEDNNFSFTYDEMNSTRSIITINLSKLDKEMRLSLCERLEHLRSSIQSHPVHRSTILALNQLQEYRFSALSQIESTYNKTNKKVVLKRVSS